MWITAAEATKLLDVTNQTLYAYVSRGLIRSEQVPGQPRVRRYSREDVERLRRRSEERRDPEKAAGRALQWGMPILESAISLIAEGNLYYRGHEVGSIVRARSVEETARLLWTGSFDGPAFGRVPAARIPSRDAGLPFVARAESALPLFAARDPLAFDLRAASVVQTGWRILNHLASIAAGRAIEGPIESALASAWGLRGTRGETIIRAALISCADHELNVSAFTARCIASAGANPYAVVTGALCALEGARHGGVAARVDALLDELRRSRDLRAAIAERLRRGDAMDGFGHKLYGSGDPRAARVLTLVEESWGRSKELTFVRSVVSAAEEVLGERPNLDFALVATQRVLGLPPGAALTIFAIGRTMGWIAHAIEQYATGAIIRPRAKYVGVVPS